MGHLSQHYAHHSVGTLEWVCLDLGGFARKNPVPVGNSHSDILVVQPAQDGHGQRLTDGLDGAGDRRVLLQR
jgi:hypothetical protein